ncbi:peptidase M61 [Autumnicola psychrophila]|uniref:Peptidase M61 n=1 Tax=Autumnicola psychrophila TaxID=3075592 RepID=A0ABU3DS54_9FLAO|nr:peptidase M61 [Zunongwangia sp. F225]MDT0686530.1 peptidase M61 [Zunongwangia sp. F225]
MKKFIYALAMSFAIFSCKTTQNTVIEEQPIVTKLDLVNVQDDRVMVTIDPAEFTTETTTFYIPKTVPGTYSTSNYGKYSEDLKAFDYKGNELEIVKLDDNSWSIPNAKKLDKITYWVNDTFDVQGEGGIYSMAGTNILEDKNFLLNLHGFVGYFENLQEKKYRVEIKRPSDLIGGSALEIAETLSTENDESKTDIYNLNRYFEVTDNPIMYAEPDTVSFNVQGMEVLLNVYSPNDKFSAETFAPAMERMITAQKNFLGDINSTDKYAILLYLSATPGQNDAGNFGALEHHTSTVVVMPEIMEEEALNESLTDIVSHEFFHIITPLGVHSQEIHFFDYNDPKMSKHLWMYEGITEYFANLFQVNQGLIGNQDFYDRINEKLEAAKRYDDTMSFTVMSENILEDEYQGSYANVYQKGALIGMALDIRLRELSGGKMGVLDLMKELTQKYGKDKPFNDDELIADIVELTYPEIQDFFDQYVIGTTPIPYSEFFEKVGLEIREGQVPVDYFLKNQTTPYITVNQQGNILVRNDVELNSFLQDLELEAGDMIQSINGTAYNRENIYDLITTSQTWNEGEPISMTIVRDGEEVILESSIVAPTAPGLRLVEIQNADSDQIELRYAWLKS